MEFKITKQIVSSQQSILLVKLHRFFTRSLFRYLLASIFFGIAFRDLFGGMVLTMLGMFLLVCLLSFIAIYVSTNVLAKRKKFDAEVSFNEKEIIIRHHTHDLTETKNWDWIVNAGERQDAFFLYVDKRPTFGIVLGKSNLTMEEMEGLRAMLRKQRLIK